MSGLQPLDAGRSAVAIAELAERRSAANEEFFGREAERIARCCHELAQRFARGGKLMAIGATPSARSDARHVSVEFVHPVIVGKRALPAIAVCVEGGPLDLQLEGLAGESDAAIAFETDEPAPGGPMAAAIEVVRGRGCQTIAFSPCGADWEFVSDVDDRFVRQELVETLYHVLWELVHVFFDHRGLLAGREQRTTHDPGASSFLYPFLSEGERNLDPVLDDVRRSVLLKSEEIGGLREETLNGNAAVLEAAASALRARFDAGGTLLALGNGGSATDAMDVVADFRDAGGGRWRARRAIDLTEDAPILTAVANDVGVEEIFQRQVIAYGHEGDALIAFSTSGGSENMLEALAEARRRGIETIAMVGYDGGRIAGEALADHVVISRSQHIPRIQEAQASAYHALRELVG